MEDYKNLRFGPDGESAELPMPRQGLIWWAQVLEDRILRFLGIVVAGLKSAALNLLFTLSLFMILYPIANFIGYLKAGVLFISPPLLLMFMAGFVGLGLSRPANWNIAANTTTLGAKAQ